MKWRLKEKYKIINETKSWLFFLKRRNSNGQKTHEKMLTIPSNKGNAS
jgi:hypothetical protein